jgi:hypothetical protein
MIKKVVDMSRVVGRSFLPIILSNLDFKKYRGSIPIWIRDIVSHHKLNQTGLQVIA